MEETPKPNPLEQGDIHGVIADIFKTFMDKLESLLPASVHRELVIDHMSEAERNAHKAAKKP